MTELNRQSSSPICRRMPIWKVLLALARILLMSLLGVLGVSQMAHAENVSFKEVAVPGAENTSFSGINDAGVITGHFGGRDPTNQVNGFTYTAFTYDGSSYSTFSAPGAWGTFARGINSQGVVVGEYGLIAGGGGAFIYDGGSFTLVNAPGAENTNFSGINDKGLIAGHFGGRDPASQGNGFSYTAFTYDGSSYSTFSVPGAWGTFARGINSQGVVVGEFGRDGIPAAYIATPVPEPTTWALLLAGFALVCLQTRRSKGVAETARLAPI